MERKKLKREQTEREREREREIDRERERERARNKTVVQLWREEKTRLLDDEKRLFTGSNRGKADKQLKLMLFISLAKQDKDLLSEIPSYQNCGSCL